MTIVSNINCHSYNIASCLSLWHLLMGQHLQPSVLLATLPPESPRSTKLSKHSPNCLRDLDLLRYFHKSIHWSPPWKIEKKNGEISSRIMHCSSGLTTSIVSFKLLYFTNFMFHLKSNILHYNSSWMVTICRLRYSNAQDAI